MMMTYSHFRFFSKNFFRSVVWLFYVLKKRLSNGFSNSAYALAPILFLYTWFTFINNKLVAQDSHVERQTFELRPVNDSFPTQVWNKVIDLSILFDNGGTQADYYGRRSNLGRLKVMNQSEVLLVCQIADSAIAIPQMNSNHPLSLQVLEGEALKAAIMGTATKKKFRALSSAIPSDDYSLYVFLPKNEFRYRIDFLKNRVEELIGSNPEEAYKSMLNEVLSRPDFIEINTYVNGNWVDRDIKFKGFDKAAEIGVRTFLMLSGPSKEERVKALLERILYLEKFYQLTQMYCPYLEGKGYLISYLDKIKTFSMVGEAVLDIYDPLNFDPFFYFYDENRRYIHDETFSRTPKNSAVNEMPISKFIKKASGGNEKESTPSKIRENSSPQKMSEYEYAKISTNWPFAENYNVPYSTYSQAGRSARYFSSRGYSSDTIATQLDFFYKSSYMWNMIFLGEFSRAAFPASYHSFDDVERIHYSELTWRINKFGAVLHHSYNDYFLLNRAHALLLKGNSKDALKIYEEIMEKPYFLDPDIPTFRDMILKDLETFRGYFGKVSKKFQKVEAVIAR